MAAYKKADFETAFLKATNVFENGFLKATKFTKGSPFNLALQTFTWPANWCGFTITSTPLLRPHFYGPVSARNSEVPLHCKTHPMPNIGLLPTLKYSRTLHPNPPTFWYRLWKAKSVYQE